jgi:hypothetical protein
LAVLKKLVSNKSPPKIAEPLVKKRYEGEILYGNIKELFDFDKKGGIQSAFFFCFHKVIIILPSETT